MGTPLFFEKTYTSIGAKDPFILNRWTRSNYSVTAVVGTAATYTFEGTISRLNQDDGLLPVWFELSGLTGLTGNITEAVKESPLEAIRIDIDSIDSTLLIQIMQGGES